MLIKENVSQKIMLKLADIHAEFNNDTSTQHTDVIKAFEKLKSSDERQKTRFLLELTETAIRQAVILNYHNRVGYDSESAYINILIIASQKMSKIEAFSSAYYFLHIWFNFYLQFNNRKHRDEEALKIMKNTLLKIAALSLMYCAYLETETQAVPMEGRQCT
jgi:hypothetical protein